VAGELSALIVELKKDELLSAVTDRVDKGENPLSLLEECRHGMSVVGDRFQKGDYFLAELILSADIFKEASALIRPCLAKSRAENPLGKVLLATLKGDIHDLGKNILATLLEAHGFEVYDLGVDIHPTLVLEKAREIKPEFIGFSALITSAFPRMKEAQEILRQSDLRNNVKIMIGGGVTTPTVKEYVGADFQTVDAMEGVRYCLDSVGGEGR